MLEIKFKTKELYLYLLPNMGLNKYEITRPVYRIWWNVTIYGVKHGCLEDARSFLRYHLDFK